MPLLPQPTSTGITIALLMIACSAITEVIKRLIIQPVVKDTDPRQNILIQVVAFVIGYALIIINTGVVSSHMDFSIAWNLLPAAISIFGGASGAYHLVNASAGQASTTDNTTNKNTTTTPVPTITP